MHLLFSTRRPAARNSRSRAAADRLDGGRPGVPPRWAVVLRGGRLELSRVHAGAAAMDAADYADTRAAWEGPLTARPDRSRARRGRRLSRATGVRFSIVAPWTRRDAMQTAPDARPAKTSAAALSRDFSRCCWSARCSRARQPPANRADRRGAAAARVLVIEACVWLVALPSGVTSAEAKQFGARGRRSTCWRRNGRLYLALEPYVRRFWPEACSAGRGCSPVTFDRASDATC